MVGGVGAQGACTRAGESRPLPQPAASLAPPQREHRQPHLVAVVQHHLFQQGRDVQAQLLRDLHRQLGLRGGNVRLGRAGQQGGHTVGRAGDNQRAVRGAGACMAGGPRQPRLAAACAAAAAASCVVPPSAAPPVLPPHLALAPRQVPWRVASRRRALLQQRSVVAHLAGVGTAAAAAASAGQWVERGCSSVGCRQARARVSAWPQCMSAGLLGGPHFAAARPTHHICLSHPLVILVGPAWRGQHGRAAGGWQLGSGQGVAGRARACCLLGRSCLGPPSPLPPTHPHSAACTTGRLAASGPAAPQLSSTAGSGRGGRAVEWQGVRAGGG